MAKKAAAAPKKPESSAPNKQLVDAIITVKSLQDFIQQHGASLAHRRDQRAEARLPDRRLQCLTQALGIVGGEPAPQSSRTIGDGAPFRPNHTDPRRLAPEGLFVSACAGAVLDRISLARGTPT
jgi:hypothetical protein